MPEEVPIKPDRAPPICRLQPPPSGIAPDKKKDEPRALSHVRTRLAGVAPGPFLGAGFCIPVSTPICRWESHRHGPRLGHCTQLLLSHENLPSEEILGTLDAMKFRSSMELFGAAGFDPVRR